MVSDFFSVSPKTIQPFHLFSTSHLMAIITIILFTIITSILFRRPQLEKYRKSFRYTFFIIFLIEEIVFKVWNIGFAHTPIRENLQLNLCAITIVLLMVILLNKNERLYEITYFWGLAGATQAILTPDIAQYGFPHFRFYQFFLSHGSIVAVIIYLAVVEGLRPKKGSIKRVFLITNAYAAVVFVINYFLDTNYLFISRKLETASALDLLGPWPWYILSLEGVALVLFTLVYSPFFVAEIFHRYNKNKHTISN